VEGISEEKSLAIAEIDMQEIKTKTKSSLRPILDCIRRFVRSISEPERESKLEMRQNSVLLAELKEFIYVKL